MSPIGRALRFLRRVFFLGFRLLDLIVPKRRNLVVLGSARGDARFGNTAALFTDWTTHDRGLDAWYYLRRPTAEREIGGFNLKTAWKLLRARTLVCTHGVTDFEPYDFSRRKFVVQTWHGIPLKTVGVADPNLAAPARRYAARCGERWDVIVAPSQFSLHLIAKCFAMDESKGFVCGQARNDALLRPRAFDLRALLPDAPGFERVVLYCPTFRRDGTVRWFPFDDFDAAALDAFLEERQALLLMRQHVSWKDDKPLGGPRVVSFDADVCPDVNDALPAMDVLITDYSSIYIDFLLTNRPMVFLPYDLDTYRNDPGFLVDGYDKWTPGRKPKTQQEFLAALAEAFDNPGAHRADRERLRKTYHEHQDDRSAEKLAAMILGR